jgi:hypothetical protein
MTPIAERDDVIPRDTLQVVFAVPRVEREGDVTQVGRDVNVLLEPRKPNKARTGRCRARVEDDGGKHEDQAPHLFEGNTDVVKKFGLETRGGR